MSCSQHCENSFHDCACIIGPGVNVSVSMSASASVDSCLSLLFALNWRPARGASRLSPQVSWNWLL